MTAGDQSLADRCARLVPADRDALFDQLSQAQCRALLTDWRFWARPKQLPPAGDWFCWLVLAGRGFGKTRLGVEWVRQLAEGTTPLTAPTGAPARIALVAETAADGREVMVDGDSGFMACCPPDRRPRFEPSRRRLLWPNGTVATLYAATEPDQLRGPQHHAAWADEIAKWDRGEAAWTNLLMGLRLGIRPRVVATTTPRPIPLIRRLAADPSTVVTRGATMENSANLSPRFLAEMRRLFDGTRLGRQELYGDLLDDTPGALWTPAAIDAGRAAAPPRLDRIVVAVDPPVTGGADADACGIVVAGCDGRGHVYVLADHTCRGLRPLGWAARAVAAYRRFDADRLVAEVNNGGDLVEAVVRQVAPQISYRAVCASRGKIARAEPVAALYERGLVHHVGPMPELEDQLCAYTGPGSAIASPDRLDALVWAVTDLVLRPGGSPAITGL